MSATAATLESRIARLEHVEQIQTLKSRYHTAINDTRFDEVGALFTEDAFLHLGYLMPSEEPIVGRDAIARGFASMKSNATQSQVKQFLHSHIVELTAHDAARGTGILLAFYGVRDESYFVSGRYDEEYRLVEREWLFSRMTLALYFTVPLQLGWAGHKRHYLINSGQPVPAYPELLPNPAVA